MTSYKILKLMGEGLKILTFIFSLNTFFFHLFVSFILIFFKSTRMLVNNLVSPKQPELGNAFLDSPFVHSHLLMPQSVSIDTKVFVKYFCKARNIFKLSAVELGKTYLKYVLRRFSERLWALRWKIVLMHNYINNY